MLDRKLVVHRDPDILGGTPVFVGTRVPIKILFDYLEAGDSLDVFLAEFPSVTHEQAVTALEFAREVLVADAHPAWRIRAKEVGFELAGHFVNTVQQVGWAGLKNGELLRKAKDRFDVLVTADQNIQYQQDLTMLPIPVVILVAVNNRIETLRPLIPSLLAVLLRIEPGQLLHVGA